jgi:hypothetical protein
MDSAVRPFLIAAVGLVGASVIAVTPVTAPFPGVQLPDIQLTAGEEDIVIDFVRHGQTEPPGGVVAVASNGLPGFPLSDTGQQQAVDVGHQLVNEFGPHVAGIFGGYEQRMIETATPFLTDEGLTSQAFQPLNGFDEIGGGIYADDPPSSPGDYLYELTVFAWVLGLRFVPLPGSNDFNGVQFEENFGGAVDTAYNDAVADPVVSANGQITDVVFSGEAAISTWTLMNVNNPDLAILLPLFIESVVNPDKPFLPNVGQVEIEGNPTEGWTLVSFNGTPIPADPGLLTQLIVDTRDLITPPQTAAYNIFEAALTGDPTTIESALQTGVQNVGAAIVQFPGSVINDTVAAVQDLGTDVAAGESFSDAFGSAILGLA